MRRCVNAVMTLAAVLAACGDDDSGSDDPTQDIDQSESDIKLCPDYLEVAGPYRRGIDPEYDPAMDWDGDGVSCE